MINSSLILQNEATFSSAHDSVLDPITIGVAIVVAIAY